MSTNVIPFRHPATEPQPIAHFIRVGYSGHQQLSDLRAEGVLRPDRVVFDASQVNTQKHLLGEFKQDGAEIVLDTKAAELAALSKVSGYVKAAPWAKAIGVGTLLSPEVYRSDHPKDVIGMMARFAVENGFDRVLSPSHLLGKDDRDAWLRTDTRSCIALREALDREGGKDIGIDYPLILQHTQLRSVEWRGELSAHLGSLPFDNLWVRAAGIDGNCNPSALHQLILVLRSLHNLGRPIVNDYLGGAAGLASLAFGASSGICHGIGERERFDVGQWHMPPKPKSDDGFGMAARVYVPSINMSPTRKELEVLFSATGAKSLLACNNRDCCPKGKISMLDQHRRHASYQAIQRVANLAATPDLKRVEHFIEYHDKHILSPSRSIYRLKPSSSEAEAKGIDLEKLMKRLEKNYLKHERMQKVLARTEHEIGGDFGRSMAVKSIRPKPSSSSSI